MSELVLQVSGLVKRFPLGRRRELTAVDGFDLEIHAGETGALIGEIGAGKATPGRGRGRLVAPTGGGGSGKSTGARSITRLVAPTGGEISLAGHDLAAASRSHVWRHYGDLQ